VERSPRPPPGSSHDHRTAPVHPCRSRRSGPLTYLGLASGIAAAAPSGQDRAFLVAAHQSSLTEIQAGKAALQKSGNGVVRQHGQLFIRDHTRLDADLRKVADDLDVDLPSQPNATQRATLASVSALSGSAFDAPGSAPSWRAPPGQGRRPARARPGL